MSAKNAAGKVILCVDDEAAGLFVRKAVLESQGYRVLTAQNGRDAIALFLSQPVDLVILDYAMPEIHGQAVAERMKEARAHVPIVMLSAYVNLPNETETLVDKCLTKGEPTLVLLGAVTTLLSKTIAREIDRDT